LTQYADDAFITTPQRNQQTQLEEDRDLNSMFEVVRGRESYECGAVDHSEPGESYTCADCPIASSANDKSCRDQDDCRYWNAKEDAMEADAAVLTPAYLAYDDEIPAMGMDADEQISFGDRQVFVVDEAHGLEGQAAGMLAGIQISPYTLPDRVYGDIHKHVREDVSRFNEVAQAVKELSDRAEEFVDEFEDADFDDENRQAKIDNKVDQCMEFLEDFERCKSDIFDGRPWVPEASTVVDRGGDEKIGLTLKPIQVAHYLRDKFWSRVENVVISTATLWYPDNPSRWLRRVGLDPDRTKVIRKPNPFHVERRPIHTETMIDRFSGGGDDENWPEIVATIRELAQRHAGEKGLIHTVSYDRAHRLHRELEDNATVDSRSEDTGFKLDQWQFSDDQIFLSPSCMEGIDLKGDKCRWQVLVKAPYPNMGASRVDYLVTEEGDWEWYKQKAAISIIQSYGRGVRSKDDYCDYYVLDECFTDIIDDANPPEWFTEAIVR
jgi:Rad3-related DNA helicase